MKYFIQILKTDVGGDARRHHHHRHVRADGATSGAQRAPILTLKLGCKPNRRLSPLPPPGSSFCPRPAHPAPTVMPCAYPSANSCWRTCHAHTPKLWQLAVLIVKARARSEVEGYLQL